MTGLRTQLRASMPYREHSHNVRHWLPQQLAHLPTGRCRCLPERPLRQRCVRQTRPRYIRQELRDGRTHGVQTRTEPLRPIAVACALERHPERIPRGVRMEKDSIRPLRVRVYQRQHHRDSHGLRRRHSHLVDQKKKELTDRFEMTDMGEVKRILGIDVQRDYEQGTLAISQEHYGTHFWSGSECKRPTVSTPGYGAEISTNQPQTKS